MVTLREHDEPPAGVTLRVTVFEKVPRAATVIVEFPPFGPRGTVTVVGLALRLIPPALVTVAVIVAVELVIPLLAPPTP